jgi:LPXTG-site transpeptidase (sortase) family protein
MCSKPLATGHLTDAPAPRAVRSRWWLYALAVTLLLVSAGLLLYNYWGDLEFQREQQVLAGELGDPPGAAPAQDATSTMDFTGWETQDKAYWRGLKKGGAFGRIVVASATIDAVVIKGAELDQLSRGPGYIVQTDLPGPEGNCGISGHRVTYGHPFRRLDALKVGATIDLLSPFRRYRYVVDRIMSVTPDKVGVVAYTAVPHLTLTTCDPPGSARRRLVVQAKLIEVRRLAGPPPRQ